MSIRRATLKEGRVTAVAQIDLPLKPPLDAFNKVLNGGGKRLPKGKSPAYEVYKALVAATGQVGTD